jgi:pimeloyl-ACP methyl ester carboxylesterase
MVQTRVVLAAAVLVAACTKASPRSEFGAGTTSSADGVPIAYEAQGQGPTTLVLIHGWNCDRTYWRQQMDSFPEYRVIAVDLAGHGQSGRSRTDWGIMNFAKDVAAVIRAEDARNVVLIGHSLGGPVAVEAGILLPDRVVGVIGVEAFYDAWADPGFSKVVDQWRPNFAAGARPFIRKALFLSNSPAALADSIADDMAAAPPEVALPAMDSLLAWARGRQTEAAASLSAPVGLIMAAGGNAGTAKFQKAREGQPSLGVAEVPGTGHFVMLEVPSAFNDKLREMLSRVKAVAKASVRAPEERAKSRARPVRAGLATGQNEKNRPAHRAGMYA